MESERWTMVFPDELDGAKVIYYTPKDDYGIFYYDTGEIAGYFKYLAICKYENDKGYYLFKCDEDMEVESDSLWDSVEQCMGVANASYGGNVVWIEK